MLKVLGYAYPIKIAQPCTNRVYNENTISSSRNLPLIVPRSNAHIRYHPHDHGNHSQCTYRDLATCPYVFELIRTCQLQRPGQSPFLNVSKSRFQRYSRPISCSNNGGGNSLPHNDEGSIRAAFACKFGLYAPCFTVIINKNSSIEFALKLEIYENENTHGLHTNFSSAAYTRMTSNVWFLSVSRPRSSLAVDNFGVSISIIG